MYKTIVAVIAFLVIALIVQLYEQDQTQARIEREQQAAIAMQSDNAARAEEAERAQARAGIPSRLDSASDSLVPESFSVRNGPPKEFGIAVDLTRMTDVIVSGHFAVSGDHNKGVEVYIFDEDDYSNWMYGNNSKALFASGRKAVGDIRARILKSGRYFLIFKNDASPTAINVTANITMQYEKIRTPS